MIFDTSPGAGAGFTSPANAAYWSILAPGSCAPSCGRSPFVLSFQSPRGFVLLAIAVSFE